MQWQDKKPTENGIYWLMFPAMADKTGLYGDYTIKYLDNYYLPPNIVEINNKSVFYIGDDCSDDIKLINDKSLWFGPITYEIEKDT